jgi:hypothetical protein
MGLTVFLRPPSCTICGEIKTAIKILVIVPVIGTMSTLAEMSEDEILRQSGPRPLRQERFDCRPFLFAVTRSRTHVFTSHEPKTALDSIAAAKRLFGLPVQVHMIECARLEIQEHEDEGPSTLNCAGSFSSQPELPLLCSSLAPLLARSPRCGRRDRADRFITSQPLTHPLVPRDHSLRLRDDAALHHVSLTQAGLACRPLQ